MAENRKLHIALFPWLAFGHMIPYLEFAKLMAQKGHRISFLCTPRNINRLPKLPPNLINFVSLPLPHVEGLPAEDAEATVDVPYDKIQYLKKAYDGLQESVTLFLQSSNPDWILYDFAPYWVAPIASRMGIKTSFFSVYTAPALGFMGPPSVLKGESSVNYEIRTKPEDYTVPPKWIDFPTTVAFRYFVIKRIFDSMSPNDSGVSDVCRMGAGIESCDVVAIRGCIDFEPEWFRLLRDLYNKPVLPIGQLPPAGDQNDHNRDDETETETTTWLTMKSWLDKHEKGTVVYVAFGTEAKLGREEVTEIAVGLEKSQLPFFWVLRLTQAATLPEGFEERIEGRGVVWKTWAPQLKILAHESVLGHLTHSGWSSVVESLRFQRALILLPLIADQGINARILEEKKMGYSVPRDERDGSFTSNAVAESLRLVMVEENGKIYRDKVKEMSGLFGDMDRQNRYSDTFLDYVKSH
nr:UDP-glycosyltransferase 91A1-like [Ziziphus jujuba var. spinosa]